MAKVKDLKVVTGTYTDRNGQEKKSWKTIGALMENQNGQYLMIDRTFNPAGVPVKDGQSSIMVSMFDHKEDEAGKKQVNEQPEKVSASVSLDDQIPW